MFYLSVLLPSVLITLFYYILIFVRSKGRSFSTKNLICFLFFCLSLIILIIGLKIAIKRFSVAEFCAVLLLYFSVTLAMVALFLQFKIFPLKKRDDFRVNSSIDATRAGKLIEIAKGALNDTDAIKTIDDENSPKLQNGLVLDNRTAQNTTAGEIEVGYLNELFDKASKAKNSYRHRKELSLAKKTIDDLSKGVSVQKVALNDVVNSLIKILSSENFEG